MAKMQYDRRAFTAGMASLLLCPASLDPAHGQQLERSSLKLGVANKSHLYYLPVTIAERRGHSNLDPVITRLQQDSAIRIIVDSRFPRVNYEIFGGTNPAAVLYARQEFIAANPATMQALVNAFYKTLRWIATATTDEIVDTVPAEYFLGERAIYVKALKANLLVYSRTGIITRQGMNSALKMMATFDPDLKDKKIDLRKTFDDRFIKRAAVLFDDPTSSDLERDERRPEIDLNTFQD